MARLLPETTTLNQTRRAVLYRQPAFGGFTMTTEQKDRVTQLRAEGKGYKRIGEILGISASTVKSYCQRNRLVAIRPEPEKQSPIISDVPHALQGEADSSACRQCGAHIDQIPGRKRKRFCSTACRMKWWRSHKDEMNHRITHTRICAGCGAEIESYGSDERKYCSRSCYINHRFKDAQN